MVVKGKRLYLAAILLCVVSLLAGACAKPAPTPTPAPAPTPTPTPAPTPTPTPAPVSFAGKTIRIILPLDVGGGNDLMARAHSPFLTKYLPGNPSVIVRAMPGANGTIGTNYAYRSAPDGTTLLQMSAGVQLAYATRMSGVEFDLGKMPVLLYDKNGAIYHIKAGLIDKPEDLPKHAPELVFGWSSATQGWLFIVVAELMDLNMKAITLGYGGAGPARMAFISGEVQIGTETPAGYWSFIHPLVENGEVQYLFQTGILNEKGEWVREPGFPPEVPTFKEVYENIYGKSPSGMAWDAYQQMLGATLSYSRGLLLPPGTPDNVLKVYRDAIEKVVKDPEHQKIMASLRGEGAGELRIGEAADLEYRKSMILDEKVLEWLRGLMAKYSIVF